IVLRQGDIGLVIVSGIIAVPVLVPVFVAFLTAVFAAVLVVSGILLGLFGFFFAGRCQHLMERQLSRLADHLGGLARILQARQLHDNAIFARACQRGLGHPQCVHTSAQHLKRTIRGIRVGFDPLGVLGLQN